MAGLNSPATSAARSFCQSLFEIAKRQTRKTNSRQVGNTECDFSISGTGNASEEVLSAFLPTCDQCQTVQNRPHIYILAREDVPVLPHFEWARPWIETHQVIPEDYTYPYRAFFDANTGFVYVYDTQFKNGVIHTRRRSETDLRGMITPFRLMWSWLAASHNSAVIHASAVRTSAGTLLFAGSSGSGKSTIAVDIALAGGHLISDDCLWISGNRCFPVFDRAKVSPGSTAVERLQQRGCEVTSIDSKVESKNFFSVSRLNGGSVQESEISKVLFPRIWPELSVLAVSSRSAFRRISSDAGREAFEIGARSLISIAKLCQSTPAGLVWLGPEPNSNIEFVLSLLENKMNL